MTNNKKSKFEEIVSLYDHIEVTDDMTILENVPEEYKIKQGKILLEDSN